MKRFERVILLVLDSVGVGALPDANKYGDESANTLANVATYVKGLHLPNLQALGLGNIISIQGLQLSEEPQGHYGKMAEASVGKDTTTGHWEIAGLKTDIPFNTYPNGFPEEIIKPFCEAIGRNILGNKTASGTDIINELGEEHMRTGAPIVYTSADSVFQVAAHEQVIPLDELYRICKVARELLVGEYSVARVIARPFIGSANAFQRTPNRKDLSVLPPQPTILDHVVESNHEVIGIGKIYDIFGGQGVSTSYKTVSNYHGLEVLEQELMKDTKGLIFTNLVDFDMMFGHRNDPVGYAKALEEVDDFIPRILRNLNDTDLLIITADHGCDPTHAGTDHTREYVPIIVYHNNIAVGNDLGIRSSFSDIAATISEALQVKRPANGTSFYANI
ncbi:phosphopentomutase [Desulfuribacillus stibiiarsenatis]|uniref:Phosphopentomutase n=1 Tax=Desulfuribacillus stibiiarsenatis TaxID=1390249 RepID=A0A1E5L6R7_9FIRM|nr:phosphopentomutase [Desulfuribacillus stibiiarsenatis]OEH85694.1 phosphopentomutase [Desulfuribacillus stibiiarsenatis]